MKYEVIKGCVVKGKACHPGEIVDLDKSQAVDLIGIGRIIPAGEKQDVAVEASENPAELENRSIGLDTSEEAPIVRKKKKK